MHQAYIPPATPRSTHRSQHPSENGTHHREDPAEEEHAGETHDVEERAGDEADGSLEIGLEAISQQTLDLRRSEFEQVARAGVVSTQTEVNRI